MYRELLSHGIYYHNFRINRNYDENEKKRVFIQKTRGFVYDPTRDLRVTRCASRYGDIAERVTDE